MLPYMDPSELRSMSFYNQGLTLEQNNKLDHRCPSRETIGASVAHWWCTYLYIWIRDSFGEIVFMQACEIASRKLRTLSNHKSWLFVTENHMMLSIRGCASYAHAGARAIGKHRLVIAVPQNGFCNVLSRVSLQIV